MSTHPEIEQISVGGFKVGIIGLGPILKEASSKAEDLDEEGLKTLLLELAEKRNYIPNKAREDYAKALLNEYKERILKEEVKEKEEGLSIKILGPGCPNCERLFKNVMEAMTKSNKVGDVEQIKDIREIGSYGVLGTPALVINGKVKSVGKVSSIQEIIKWLNEA